jgi:uncharacterized protein DUF4349
MRSRLILLLAVLSFSISCSSQRSSSNGAQTFLADSVAQKTAPQNEALTKTVQAAETEKVSLTDVDKAGSTAEAFDRKIIRNADITIEAASTTEAQHSVTSIAEAHGGFVASSEAKQRDSADPEQRTMDIKLVVRVPSNQFGATFDQIKALASNTPQENVNSQDVTEDFIDLEARIKTQKALEVQFLEIMRQANKVADALEVQRQIADVRTEIEKLEGRKRFLENRSSLSTINVNINAPKPAKPIVAVTSAGFGQSLREAVSDSIDLGSDIVLFLARFVILMVPVFVLVLLPSGLLIRYLLRRAKRMRLAHELATPSAQ